MKQARPCPDVHVGNSHREPIVAANSSWYGADRTTLPSLSASEPIPGVDQVVLLLGYVSAVSS